MHGIRRAMAQVVQKHAEKLRTQHRGNEPTHIAQTGRGGDNAALEVFAHNVEPIIRHRRAQGDQADEDEQGQVAAAGEEKDDPHHDMDSDEAEGKPWAVPACP